MKFILMKKMKMKRAAYSVEELNFAKVEEGISHAYSFYFSLQTIRGQ